MIINVKLIGLFKTGRFTQRDLEVPEGSRVDDVISSLGLPRQHFGIVLVNERHAEPGSPLHEADRLVLMPIVDGG